MEDVVLMMLVKTMGKHAIFTLDGSIKIIYLFLVVDV
jgi:hypothetical protein